MKSGKWHMMEGVELPKQEKIRRLKVKGTYKYLGILETDTIKQGNLIKGINTSAVPLVRYSVPFLKTTSEELKQMD